MTYVLEQDLLRPELLTGAAGTIELWPKANGRNVQVTSPTAVVYDPDGVTVLQSPTPTANDVTLGSRTVTRIDVPVAAISTPDEDHILRVAWSYGGSTVADIVTFDVCLSPLASMLGLSDLLEIHPDLEDVLGRLGQLLGYTAGQEAQEYAAGVYVVQARQRMQAKLQSRAREDERIRPHMLIDRRAVSAVERLFAMVAIYEALGGTDDEIDDSPAGIQVRHWQRRANSAWADLRIKYMDHDATTSAPAGETHFGRAFVMERC